MSTFVLVGSEFLPHTQGLRDWRGGGWFQDPFEYERGSLTGWEYGDAWVTVPAAATAALCVAGYLATRRQALLIVALVAAVVGTLWILLGLAFLPDECGGGFLELPCPPGLDVLREEAWGLYVTLGAAVSLVLACLMLVHYRPGGRPPLAPAPRLPVTPPPFDTPATSADH